MDDKLQICIEYVHKVDAACFGVWTVPHKKRIECASRDLLERIIIKVNQHIRRAGQREEQQPESVFNQLEVADLSIMNSPYVPVAA